MWPFGSTNTEKGCMSGVFNPVCDGKHHIWSAWRDIRVYNIDPIQNTKQEMDAQERVCLDKLRCNKKERRLITQALDD